MSKVPTSGNMYHRKDQLKCTYCPDSVPLVEDFQAGDLICTGCGLVVGDRVIDVGAEWRSFSNDALLNKSRVGAEESVLFDGMDMSTIIGPTGPSTVAYTEDGERKYRNKKCLNSSQRSMVTGFKEIAEMAEKLNTTRPVIESGQLIFKKIQTKHALKGRSNASIAAACLFFAYRKNNVPRTFKEICAVAKSSKKDIGKCFKVISNVVGEVLAQSSAVDYIPRFSAHLELPTAVENRARHLVKRFESLAILAGRNPTTIAALAIMMAIDALEWNPKDQTGYKFASAYAMKKIAEVTGAAESTIRDAHQVVKTQGGKEFKEYFPTEQNFKQQQPALGRDCS